MKRVAVIGTVGVPAAYGGFETLVENIIGESASEGIEYTVYCSSKDSSSRLESYKGAKLKYVGLHANGIQSIIYDGVSMLRSLCGYDVILVLGVSGGVFMPLLRLLSRSKIVVNIDGLEWKRAKWSNFAKKFLRFSERISVRCAHSVIADNQGIIDYVEQAYGKRAHLIAYGGDHVIRDLSEEKTQQILESYKVQAKGYAMKVCRIEPENNCHIVLEIFAKCGYPLIFIGNWEKSAYGVQLKAEYSNYPNINIISAVYDLDDLYALRSNSRYYVHGHTAGGTNPSLVEAMFCGCNILACGVIYNRETTEGKASYFDNAEQLEALLEKGDDNSEQMLEIANRRYTWATIVSEYEALY